MAGGITCARDGAPRVLISRDKTSSRKIAGLAVAAVMALAACAEGGQPPTRAPVPTLVVVTATPGPPPAPTPGQRQRYVVREGDTISGIAARFGVSEDAILEENPLSDRDRVFVGQELVIPPAPP